MTNTFKLNTLSLALELRAMKPYNPEERNLWGERYPEPKPDTYDLEAIQGKGFIPRTSLPGLHQYRPLKGEKVLRYKSEQKAARRIRQLRAEGVKFVLEVVRKYTIDQSIKDCYPKHQWGQFAKRAANVYLIFIDKQKGLN